MTAFDTPGCARCRFFDPGAGVIESELPGLRILSSAYGSVRSDDGLCRQHQRYVASSSICAAYRETAAVLQPA
jgi:hypothetical protein